MNQEFQQADQSEHETHVPALVFLVLVTAVVAAVVATYNLPHDKGSQVRVTQSTVQTQQPEAITYRRTRPVNTTADLPSGFLLGDYRLLQNKAVKLSQREQRIVVFATDLATQEVSDAYRKWFREQGFSLTGQSSHATGGSLTAENGNKQAIVVFNNKGSGDTRVQFNLIAESET